MIALSGPGELDLDGFRRIVAGESLTLLPSALERVAEGRELLERHLAAGGSAYGVTSGLGYLASSAVGASDQAALQHSLVTARACGLDGALPAEVVRGAMVARLAGFLTGHAGVTPALCRFVAERLNDGWCPLVPAAPHGAAGEIGPLAHLFQTLVGEGSVLQAGAAVPARAALAARGLDPYELATKEGIALVNGSPFATSIAAASAARGMRLLDQANRAAALALALVGASTRPLSARVARLSGDPAQERTASELVALLAGGPAWEDAPQSPVSYRVVPQVHGALLDRLGELERTAALRLGAVTDSPLLLDAAEGEPAGSYPSGGFHAAGTVVVLESVTIAVSHVTNLVEKRLHRLLDARFSGLPEQLAPVPGRQAGAVALHKAVTALAVGNRLLAAPASVHATDTSAGQEDVQTFTFLVFDRLEHAFGNLESALACELVALRQAASLRGGELRAPALAGLVAALAEVVEPLEEDRMLAPDVARVRELLRAGAL